MIPGTAFAQASDLRQDKVLAYIVDELRLAIDLVRDAELNELTGPLRTIVDEAQRQLDLKRQSPRAP